MSDYSIQEIPFLNVWISLIFGAIIAIIIFVLQKYFPKPKISKKTSKSQNKNKNQAQIKDTKTKENITKNKKKTVDIHRWSNRDKHGYSHPWLITTFKGHTGEVLDIDCSSNGKYLASCSEDRTVLLWYTDDIVTSKKDHKSLRINVEFDHAIFVKWSPDRKSFIIQKSLGNCIEVYQIEKRKDGFVSAKKWVTFPKITDDDVVGFGISSTGKYIMTCTATNLLTIWDLRGKILSNVETVLMVTYGAKISPCGRFVAAFGFSPDCKILEIVFSKNGEFQMVKRAFELTGHTSGIYDISFTTDSSYCVTISKDGTWRVYNIKIDYHKGEDPHLVISGKYENMNVSPHIVISPNADVVIIAITNKLLFYDVLSASLDSEVDEIFNGNITRIICDSTGKYVLVSGDRYIRAFHNVTSYRTEIADAEKKLKQHQTSATKERLQKLIRDNKKFLSNLKESYVI